MFDIVDLIESKEIQPAQIVVGRSFGIKREKDTLVIVLHPADDETNFIAGSFDREQAFKLREMITQFLAS